MKIAYLTITQLYFLTNCLIVFFFQIKFDIAARTRTLEFCGFSLSLAALLLSITIFCRFRYFKIKYSYAENFLDFRCVKNFQSFVGLIRSFDIFLTDGNRAILMHVWSFMTLSYHGYTFFAYKVIFQRRKVSRLTKP